MNTKHTPTPWTAYKSTTRFHLEDKEGTVLAINGGMIPTDADAAFIVRACNAHDEMVAALEGVLLCAELNQDDLEGDTRYQIENAQAVLSKAKGE